MKSRGLPTRLWAALLAALFLLLGAGALWLNRTGADARVAEILVDGQVVRRIPLAGAAPETFEIRTGSDAVNVVEVRAGGIRMAGADCPDQVCVRQGWLEKGNVPIVCLPHRVVIRLTGESAGEGEPDIIAGGPVQ